jgi:DNA-binding transcriptional regulator GbsR (MarR family)
MYGTLCLYALYHGPGTPTSISKSTGIHLSHVSGTLRVLSSNGLVECANPKARKNRVYKICKKGIWMLRHELPVAEHGI